MRVYLPPTCRKKSFVLLYGMVIFSFLLFPLAFLFFFQKKISVALIGMLTAVVLCSLQLFFALNTPFENSSFVAYFFENWFSLFCVPLFLYSVLQCALVKQLNFCFDDVLPFVLSFFTICYPFLLFLQPRPYSFFLLFVKPVLLLGAFFLLQRVLQKTYVLLGERKLCWIGSGVLALLCSFFEPFVETIWYFALLPAFVWIVFSVVFLSLSLGLFLGVSKKFAN